MAAFVFFVMMASKKGIEAGRAYVKAWLDDSAVTRGFKRMRASVISISESIGSVGQKLIGAGIGLAGIFALPLNRAAMLELMTADLAVLLGGVDKAKQALKDWRKFAAETPLEFADVAKIGKQLLAWGVATEENVVEVMQKVGDAAGGIPERMRSVVRALGKMTATGRIQADEMNILTEAAIPAWELLADVLGTDVAGAMDLVTRRQVDTATAVPALIDALGKFGEGRMAAMALTLTGRLSTLKDSLWEAVTPLGNALLPYAGRFVIIASKLVDRIGAWIKANAQIAVKVAATAAAMIVLGGALIAVSVAMKGLVFVVGGLGAALRLILLPATIAVTAATRVLASASFAFSAAAKAMAATVAAVTGAFKGLALASSALGWALAATTLALKFFRAAAVKTRIAVMLAAAATATLTWTMRTAAATTALFGGALRLLGVSAAALGGIFAALGSPLGAIIIAIAALAAGVYFAMQQSLTFGDVITWLKDRFGPLAQEVIRVLKVVHDAMMAGEMGAAATVMWAAIQLAWAKGIAWIQSAWISMQTWLASTFINLASEVESVWAAMSSAIASGLLMAAQKAAEIAAAIADKLGLDTIADQLRTLAGVAGAASAGISASGSAEQERIEARRRATQEALQEDAARRRKAAIDADTADEAAALAQAMKDAKAATKEATALASPVEAPRPPGSDGGGMPSMTPIAGKGARDAANTAAIVGTGPAAAALAKAMSGRSQITPDGKLLAGKLDDVREAIEGGKVVVTETKGR